MAEQSQAHPTYLKKHPIQQPLHDNIMLAKPSGNFSRLRWRGGRVSLLALIVAVIVLVAFPPNAEASCNQTPGCWTQADINNAVVIGVDYIDRQFNGGAAGGTHWLGGSNNVPIAQTGMALLSYSVLTSVVYNGDFSQLPVGYQNHVKAAITWLLGQQNTTDGWWADGGFKTYSTGIALAGLSWLQGVDPGVPGAIAKGRNYLINKDFNGTIRTHCSLAPPPTGDWWCGGWSYEDDANPSVSDQSNTGFAIFGLDISGGVPPNIQTENTVWQTHIQEIKPTNPYATRNDGGGDYRPRPNLPADHYSNSNDTGTMLFSYGYNGVLGNDPGVIAGVAFAEDVLDVYELDQGYTMIFHDGATLGNVCLPGPVGGACAWHRGSDGGFHYSMFSLTKGLSKYETPMFSDANNWYAKVVDLLLTQQIHRGTADGSWPVDGRDDSDDLIAAAFAIPSLGCVGCTGYIEICKASDADHPVTGQFTFDATTPGFDSGPITVPVGQCSGAIKVPSGAVTVTETPKLGVAVNKVTAIAYDELGFQHNELGSWTLPDLHALVHVMAGDQDEETLTTFTNYAASPGLLKLCKVAGDRFTLGQLFTFTVTIGNNKQDYNVTAGPPQQGGDCVVIGNFPVNTQAMIVEHPTFNFIPTGITINDGQLAACQPPSAYCAIATTVPGITEVTFTNQRLFQQKRCMECDANSH